MPPIHWIATTISSAAPAAMSKSAMRSREDAARTRGPFSVSRSPSASSTPAGLGIRLGRRVRGGRVTTRTPRIRRIAPIVSPIAASSRRIVVTG